jgi:chaperone modulatory protein CbpM
MRELPEIYGEVLDEDAALSIKEVCEACGIDAAWLDELMAHGAITHVSAASITRIRKARRLERDFELNPPAVALVLELLDQIERLRSDVERRDWIS